MQEQHHSDSFVVRIWWEKEQNERTLWRGWVHHARTGQASYFASVPELLAFVQNHTGPLNKHPQADKSTNGLK